MENTCVDNNLTSKLGICEVCAKNGAKYTCPRCEVKTCGLRCVKIHKLEFDCGGDRDKTKYVPLNKFTNLDLSSDYRFLEEITRNVQTIKKNNKQNVYPRGLPIHLRMLHRAMTARKIKFRALPRHFKRHQQNKTYISYKDNVVLWHVDWLFVNADGLKLSDNKIPETTKLSSLLHKYLVEQEDKVLHEKLQYYRAVDLPGIKAFLKAEQKSRNKFYELDLLISLKDNLKNKVVIEYPVIHVVLKEHSSCYDVLYSDEEEDMETAITSSNAKVVLDKIIKNAEKEESINNSLKNLLFISDNSDGDESNDEIKE